MEDIRDFVPVSVNSFTSLMRTNLPIDQEILSAYFRVIERRSFLLPSTIYKVLSFDKYFYIALKQKSYHRIATLSNGQNLLTKDVIFIPVQIPEEKNHWILLVAIPKMKYIAALDPLGKSRHEMVQDLFLYFAGLSRDFSDEFKSKWMLCDSLPCIRQKENSVDSGVYICAYAERIANAKPLNGYDFDPASYRKQIASTLRRADILGRIDLTGKEYEQQLFVNEKQVRHIPPPLAPTYRPDFQKTFGTYTVSGEQQQSWDPQFEELMNACENNYLEFQSPITFELKRTSTTSNKTPARKEELVLSGRRKRKHHD